MVKILKEAYTTAFTICFNCKVDEKAVKDRLSTIEKKEFEDSKTLAKELLKGREATIVARLTKIDENLGRSTIIGLEANSFAQVDHRTIKWLIFKNVKYVVS